MGVMKKRKKQTRASGHGKDTEAQQRSRIKANGTRHGLAAPRNGS
jgi:hypothetical protein